MHWDNPPRQAGLLKHASGGIRSLLRELSTALGTLESITSLDGPILSILGERVFESQALDIEYSSLPSRFEQRSSAAMDESPDCACG